jgi:hypothetical protein
VVHRRLIPFPLVGLLAALSACAYQPTPTSDTFGFFDGAPYVQQLSARTEYDLGCPSEQLTFKKLGTGTVGVSGCGNRATYKYVQHVGWIMDAAGVEGPPPAQPEAPAPAAGPAADPEPSSNRPPPPPE